MALKVHLLDDEETEEMATKNWLADRDLYLDATKTHVVEAGEPGAAFLLCRRGRVVKGPTVVKYKLKDRAKAKQKQPAKAKPKAKAKASDKAVKKGEDK